MLCTSHPLCAAGFCVIVASSKRVSSKEKTAMEMWQVAAIYTYVSVLQAKDFDGGVAMPCVFEDPCDPLAYLIPDKQQYKVVARLLRGLLHPNPACRATVDQALSDDFLHGI